MKVFLGFIVESLTIFSLLLAQYSLSEETYKELNEINPVFHDKESILKLINEEELKSPILEKKPTSLPNEIITLSFVGDCTIGGDESYRGNTFFSVYNQVKDPSYFFKEVQTVFKNDDYTFINLEGVFTSYSKRANKEFRYKGPPEYVKILSEGSIEGVSLANNHTLDYFNQGFEDTVSGLEKENIDYAYFEKTIIKEIKGIKVGYLAYKGWGSEKQSNDLLVKTVKEMRKNEVDFIVANYHWGDMYQYYPNASQKRMAHFAIDNGVDLVIGHHPHILQGMEIYKDKNILYSLGNFCYGGHSNPKDKDSIIYQHIIEFNPNTKTIDAHSHKIIPAKVSGEKTRNNFQPIIEMGEEYTRIMDKFNDLRVKSN